MTINDWLKQAERKLNAAGIGTARLDALVLLEDCLNTNRAQLLAEPELKLTDEQLSRLKSQIERRMVHEPLAYIRGKTEFFGRDFVVNKSVLEPRPESETMIELLKKYAPKGKFHLADVGTGSGALGITAQLELPRTTVDLLEIDEAAIEVAKMNVVNHTIGISVIKTDLLEGSSEEYDVLLCNLPYVPDDFHINQAAKAEPRVAIFGGPDGLDPYRKLFSQIEKIKKRPLLILTESLPPQHQQMKQLAQVHHYALKAEEDFIQVFTPQL